MASLLDVGTLSGTVEVDDRLSSALDTVISKVSDFASKFLGEFEGVAIGAGLLATAVLGVAATITELGIKGSEVNNVTAGFDRLSGGVENANSILEAMRSGVVGTMSDMALMTNANKLMAAGVQGNATDFGTLTEAARVLSREGFGPMPDLLDKIDRAMMTGQVTRLGRIGVTIDLKSAELAYAASLGLSVAELDPLQILEAKRQAVLAATTKLVAEAGAQQMSFSEQMSAARTAIENWVEDLEKAVASSPHLMAAFDSIKKAIQDTFGGGSQTLLDTVLGWVNSFADAVTTVAPPVIHFFGDLRDAFVFLADHADIFVPLAAGITAFGVVATGLVTAGALTSLVTSLSAIPAVSTAVAAGFATMSVAAGPLVIASTAIAAIVAVGYQAWKLYQENQDRAAAGTRQHAVDMANAARVGVVLAAAIVTLPPALNAASVATEAHAKKVDALVASLQVAAAKVDITSDAFDKLTGMQKLSLGVQEMMLPLLDKIIADGGQLTDAEKSYYEAVVVSRQNIEAKNVALLAAQDVTLQQINSLKVLGDTEAEIAEKLGTTVQALKAYTAQLTATTQENTKLVQEGLDLETKLHGDNIDDWIKAENYKSQQSIATMAATGKFSADQIAQETTNHQKMVDGEIQARAAQITTSRAYFQAEADAAKNKLDLMLSDVQDFTAQDIQQSQQNFNSKERDLEHWAAIANVALDALKGKTDKTQAAVIQALTPPSAPGAQTTQQLAAQAAADKQLFDAGGSFTVPTIAITAQNKASMIAYLNMIENEYRMFPGRQAGVNGPTGLLPNDISGWTTMLNEQIEFMALKNALPGFAEGGTVMVGENGAEAVRLPFGSQVFPSGTGSAAPIVNHWYVNGTGADVAKKAFSLLMQQLKSQRQFS